MDLVFKISLGCVKTCGFQKFHVEFKTSKIEENVDGKRYFYNMVLSVLIIIAIIFLSKMMKDFILTSKQQENSHVKEMANISNDNNQKLLAIEKERDLEIRKLEFEGNKIEFEGKKEMAMTKMEFTAEENQLRLRYKEDNETDQNNCTIS